MARTQERKKCSELPRIREFQPTIYQQLLNYYNTTHKAYKEKYTIYLENISATSFRQTQAGFYNQPLPSNVYARKTR